MDDLVVCINQPARFDVDQFRRRVAGLARSVEVLAAPYRENLKLRRARRTPPVPPELLATAPEMTPELLDAYARSEVLLGLDLPPDLPKLAPRLRWVQAYSAGTEHYDLLSLERAGILLTTAAGAGAAPIAEFVIGRLLEVWKQTRAVETMQRERSFTRPRSRLLSGCTLGVIGLGAIGGAVAERARALGMRVLATRRRFEPGQTSPIADELYGPAGLDQVLERSDAVVLSAPATPETENLLDARAIARMKPGAVLCNVARGALVDEAALIAALESGQVGAAVLDVTRTEPLPSEDPLWDAPNLYLSPHCAVSPDVYDERILELFASNIARYAAGEEPANRAFA